MAYYTGPDCWWFGPGGIWIKPDAHVMIQNVQILDRWDVEVDRATESLTTIKTKLRKYLDQATSPEADAEAILPKVLVTVPDERRQSAIAEVLELFPTPAEQLFDVVVHDRATAHLVSASESDQELPATELK